MLSDDPSAGDDIGYVMDDGLTSLSAKEVFINGTPYLYTKNPGSSEYYITFIGTGLSIIKANANNEHVNVAQNLPYGTHILRFFRNSSTSDVFLGDVQFSGSQTTISAFDGVTFHQPKKPPIPEDAVVLSDYMLMADHVKQTTATFSGISKGMRFIHASRDVFYNSSNSTAIVYQPSSATSLRPGATPHGVQGASGQTLTAKLAFFGTTAQGYGDRGSRTTTLNGTAKAVTNLQHGSQDKCDVHTLASGVDLGVVTVSEAQPAGSFVTTGLAVNTPIHTSSHYQAFETPYLNELVGGDRNMEQHNLICSPDGKTWDDITRSKKYLGPRVALQIQADTAGNHANEMLIFKKHRGGTTTGHIGNKFNKGIVYGYDRAIILEDGEYDIYFSAYSGATDIDVYVKLNDAQTGGSRGTGQIKQLRIDPADEVGIFKSHLQLKRGDFICITTNSILTFASSILEIRKRD